MKDNSTAPSVEHIAELCAREYDVTGRISRLPGENYNYRIVAEDDQAYVLKLAGDELSSEMLELEHLVVEHVYAAGIGVDVPRVVTNRANRIMTEYRMADGTHLRARLLEYVSGRPWCEAGASGKQQLRDLGRMLGALDLALSEQDHPAAHRTHRWDLTTAAAQHRGKIALLEDPKQRRIAEWMFHVYAACSVPHLADMPHSIIHGDANDENVLVQDGRVSGLLDFADCLYNPTICELAVALTYAMLDQSDPMQVGAEIVGSYHTIRPLSMDELAMLYPLICGRLCTTVTVAAERRQIDPVHPNWFVTEARAWRLLERLFTIDPAEAGTRLSSGTGMDPYSDGGTPMDVLVEKRHRYIGRSLSIAYREPIKMVRGAGQYLYDERGRPFLDLVNNVCHVGHCHPRVVEAGQRQLARLNTNTRYVYDGLTEYAERLCATLPESLDTCFFLNSGSEANELALRLAMMHTGQRDFVVVEGAYHGNTTRLIDISPYKFMGKGGAGKPEPWVHVTPLPDGYRGVHKGHDRAAGVAYGDEVGGVIAESKTAVAGFIVEPLLSCGGLIIPPEGYLETAFQHVRAAGGLCIVDEVQVGFGRVGTHFWAFEMQNVIPDIVVMGKPIGNGHPMAAVVTTREIAASFANGMEFFSTFGGNPVSCAIGLAVLDVIEDEGLQQHALEMGAHLCEGLRDLMAEHSLVGEVRGAGLFIGVELVGDRSTLDPAAEEASELVERLKVRGMLLSTDGPLQNVIKIKPAMVLTADDIDMVVRGFGDELSVMKQR
ncbi:MAG: aminotransferase class III-fold pyridoxal phosphate-dependent enzyme [Anaerolineales bacterium]|nr:aminotransferase class III-fold pyridoxal phosphate-dependent enzyme [Anaerolineales bacterium]